MKQAEQMIMDRVGKDATKKAKSGPLSWIWRNFTGFKQERIASIQSVVGMHSHVAFLFLNPSWSVVRR